jgi:hypothetical protein
MLFTSARILSLKSKSVEVEVKGKVPNFPETRDELLRLRNQPGFYGNGKPGGCIIPDPDKSFVCGRTARFRSGAFIFSRARALNLAVKEGDAVGFMVHGEGKVELSGRWIDEKEITREQNLSQ